MALKCKEISNEVIVFKEKNYDKKDRIIDKYLTSKFFGTIVMIMLLFIVLWITIVGANYPSKILYDVFFKFEGYLFQFLNYMMEHIKI